MLYSKEIPDDIPQPWKVTRNGSTTDYSDVAQFDGLKIGESVDYFRRKINAGADASSYYLTDRITANVSAETCSHHWRTASLPSTDVEDSVYGCFPAPVIPNHLTIDREAVKAEALSNLYSKIRAEKGTFNGILFTGELHKTLQGIVKPAMALRKAFVQIITSFGAKREALKHLNGAKRRNALLDAAAGTTLEWNFGVQPLLSDVKEIALVIAKIATPPPRRTRVVSRARATASTYHSGLVTTDPTFSNYIYGTSSVSTVSECAVQYISYLTIAEALSSGNTLENVISLSGFRIENFVPTIYEMIPYSWMVDYATNLGDIIEAASTDTSAVNFSIETIRDTTRVFYRSSVINPEPALTVNGHHHVSISGGLGSADIVRTTLERRPLHDNLPIPALIFHNPLENWKHMGNVIALATQSRNSDNRLLRL